MSQPSRAVFSFCLLNKIPHKVHEVSVVGLEQYSKEYKAINPNAKVPALRDVIMEADGTERVVDLYESHSMLRYLHETRGCADHWYPRKDMRLRAKIDEYLDWHHTGIRLGAGGYVFRKYMTPLTGKPAP